VAVSFSLYPTTVAATTGATWTNTGNATGSGTGTNATWTNATNGGTGSIQLSGYAVQTWFGAAPSAISSVALTLRSSVSNTTNISAVTAQLYAGASAIGSAVTATRSTTLGDQTVTFSGANAPTWAQCSDLRLQVNVTHGANTTSATFNVDTVGITVTYTPAKVGTLISDFSTLPAFLNDNFGGATVSGGVGVLPCTSGYTGMQTGALYDLSASAVAAQIVSQPGDGGNGTREFFFELDLDGSNQVMMFDTGGLFIARLRQAGVNTEFNLGTYSSTTHAWWRIRESAGTIFWDTSTDGNTWTNRASSTYTLAITALTLVFSCGYYGAETSPPDALVDNLNIQIGSAVAALGGLSATANGTPKVVGTSSAVLGSLAATAGGTPKVTASVSAAFGRLVGSASGSRALSGASAAPLGVLVASAVGTRAEAGSAVVTFGPLAATAVAVPAVPGSAAATFGSLSATASGTPRSSLRPLRCSVGSPPWPPPRMLSTAQLVPRSAPWLLPRPEPEGHWHHGGPARSSGRRRDRYPR
jgi:hypothetical protein